MTLFILTIPQPKFPRGQIVITSNANARLPSQAVNECLIRHASGDWGEVCKDDAALNNDALKAGDRVLSVYRSGETKFWIITEADRSVTTVLMPEDY